MMDNGKSITGVVSAVERVTGSVQVGIIRGAGKTQRKTVTPTATSQLVTPDNGFDALGSVKVEAIPNNYGLITYEGSRILVS